MAAKLSVRGFIWTWQTIEAAFVFTLLAWRWNLITAVIGCLPVMIGLRFVMIGFVAVLVSWLNPDHRLTRVQFWRYWYGETLAFCRLYFWDQAKPRPRLGHEIGERHVIFVHGFLCNDGFWQPLAKRVTEQGFSVSGVEMREAFASIDRQCQLLEKEVQRVRRESAKVQINVVAFSMGGLASRALPEPVQEHLTLISLYTPHLGSYLAWLSLIVQAENGRQMCPGSEWLSALNRRRSSYRRQVGLWTRHDTIIIPPMNAQAEYAALALSGRGHLSAAYDRRLHRHVLRLLRVMNAPAKEPSLRSPAAVTQILD